MSEILHRGCKINRPNEHLYSVFIRSQSAGEKEYGWCFRTEHKTPDKAIATAKRIQNQHPRWDVLVSKNSGEVVYEQMCFSEPHSLTSRNNNQPQRTSE